MSPDSSLVEALDGLKIAHLSDLHIKKIGPREEKVLEILKKEQPDLILITGDSISFRGPYDPAMSFFNRLKAGLGVYAVLGNTEYSNESGSCIYCHEEKSKDLKAEPNPIFLRNSNLRLNIQGKIVNLVGVDDPVDKKSDLKKAMSGIKLDAPTILLAHSPEIFEEASNLNIDLLLCGHTHGGQFFGVKILSKMFPLIDPTLEFLSGFFQKGKMLMYVSRGIGVSFLPFRLGVKPEVAFFRLGGKPGHEGSILNNPPRTVFAGLTVSSLIDTFDIVSRLGSSKSGQDKPSDLLFDFESEKDLERLNWQCHKWFELSDRFVTSGKHSLRAVLPPGQYPGIAFKGVREDWSGYGSIRFDVGNPSAEEFTFHVRIDDDRSGWEYANRFDVNFRLKPGMNHLSIPTPSIRRNIKKQPLNLKKIERMMVFLPDNMNQRELYLDNIRLQ